MSGLKDSAIKLFGKTIQLLHVDHIVLAKSDEQQHSCSDDMIKKKTTSETEDTCSNPSTSSGINDDPKTPTADNEITSSKNPTKKENQITNSNSEEKPQKPDKILPCPRCNSMDTKFCYYNNYNVNQPRHFCKNCQRYWTAGGTMRNTPVGSGRRKNKSSSSLSASYYRHLIVSEAFQPSWKNNGSVLNFGSNANDSMNSALNFSDKSQKSEDDHSSISVQKNNNVSNLQKYPCTQIPCFPPPPPPHWPYPWNFQEIPKIPLPKHASATNLSGFPVSFYPPPPQYWGCTIQPLTPWSMPWVAPQNDKNTPHSPLGKHSRDGYLVSQSVASSNSRNEEFSRNKDSESGVLTPKTLRVKNPNEAAKSSLWSTLGISKGENGNNNNGGNFHKAFQVKSNEKKEVVDVSSLVNLQANPAAFSRSLNFRETS